MPDNGVIERFFRTMKEQAIHGRIFHTIDEVRNAVRDFAKLNGVDPQRYFTEVLTRLVNGWMESRIDELMPWHWAASKTAERQAAATMARNLRLRRAGCMSQCTSGRSSQ